MSRLLQEGDARECRVADMLREFGSTINHGCLAIAPARPFASASASASRESEELFRVAHRAGELWPRGAPRLSLAWRGGSPDAPAPAGNKAGLRRGCEPVIPR
jgi:hypothetical protein